MNSKLLYPSLSFGSFVLFANFDGMMRGLSGIVCKPASALGMNKLFWGIGCVDYGKQVEIGYAIVVIVAMLLFVFWNNR